MTALVFDIISDEKREYDLLKERYSGHIRNLKITKVGKTFHVEGDLNLGPIYNVTIDYELKV